MKRSDIVTLAMKGPYTGKPRPAVILQSDFYGATDSLTLCLLTSDGTDTPLGRVPVAPTKQNSLKTPCFVMIDKLVTVPRDAVGKRIGKLDRETMIEIERSLALFLGLGSA
jgi:mRNA interferase MazF